MFTGILHHLKILCKELGIGHLTYGKDGTTAIGGFLTLLGFKRCACGDMAGPSKWCIAIPLTQRVVQEVPLNDRAQGAKRVGANFMHSASDEDDLSTITSGLDRGDEVRKIPRRRGKKVYCTHWLSKGNCAYMQQGCIYKHEIPRDQETWESLGFHTIPGWLQAKSSTWINQHLRKSPELSEDFSAEGSSITRSQPQINMSQNLGAEDSDRRPAHKRLQIRPDVEVANVPSLYARPGNTEGLSIIKRSQPQINTSQNLRESGDRPPAHKRLQMRPTYDMSRGTARRNFEGVVPDIEVANVPSLCARPGNKRTHPSSTDVKRKRAREDRDGSGHPTSSPKRPTYQEDLFPEHAKKGAIESSRLHSTDTIDDPGWHVRCASRGHRGNSRESSYQAPNQWSTTSTGSTSGASCGNDYGADPVLQASQFLGDWQVETPDVVWGSYPSHESYPPNRPHYLRDPYRPGNP